MLENLMGNMEAQQEEMRKKLASIELEAEAGDGAIVVTGNAARQVTSVKFDREKLDWEDTEQVEDLLVVAVNGFLQMVAEVEGEESQKMIQNMLPPGLAGMFGG